MAKAAADKPSGAGEKSRSTATAMARKRLIAGAVVDILATEGARALTHRRIDSFLELPLGATSYYFPRRFELLKAGFNRMFDDGFEEFTRCYRAVIQRIDADEPLDVELTATAAHRHWKAITQPSRRDLAIARFEFYLLATHDPKLLAVQNERRRQVFELMIRVFTALGCRNARRAASEFSSRAQGDYISHFIAPSLIQTERTPEELAVRIRQIIAESDAIQADRTSAQGQAALIAI